MKILNLYAGLGGNRKLWDGVEAHQITAVELDPKIADVYARLYPEDMIIVGDAHAYLLEHLDEFDLVWTSRPCQTHTKLARATRHKLRRYPDFALYEEIVFLQTYSKGLWVAENVKPYYPFLIPPRATIDRHCFWSNFPLVWAPDKYIVPPKPKGFINLCNLAGKKAMMDWLGIYYEENIYYGKNHCPAQILRNCVHPVLGRAILDAARANGGRR